jgi:hypothetical protein
LLDIQENIQRQLPCEYQVILNESLEENIEFFKAEKISVQKVLSLTKEDY